MLGFLQMENTDCIRLNIPPDWRGKLLNLTQTWRSIAGDRMKGRNKKMKLLSTHPLEFKSRVNSQGAAAVVTG